MLISDWSSDVGSSDRRAAARWRGPPAVRGGRSLSSEARPAGRNPCRVLHFVPTLRVRPAFMAGLTGRSRRPPRSAGAAVVLKSKGETIMELKHIDIAQL